MAAGEQEAMTRRVTHTIISNHLNGTYRKGTGNMEAADTIRREGAVRGVILADSDTAARRRVSLQRAGSVSTAANKHGEKSKRAE